MPQSFTRCLAVLLIAGLLNSTARAADKAPSKLTPEEVKSGLKSFFVRTAQPDGSFNPGIDPEYRGMSDSAYSDFAPVTYACTLSATFGWELPMQERTIAWLHKRQNPDGSFYNVKGTVDPKSTQGQTYNTTQGLVALHALGEKPRHNPLPIFEEILKADYKDLPSYSTSFFPLAYLCYGKEIPAKADLGIRALMVQDETGYTDDHVAATFHASHYYNLIGVPTPKAREMVDRILRDQKPDGSWMLNLPSRDRHATFDAVFTLVHEGGDRADCREAIDRAVQWALKCHNDDGGFGHYPGSTSDADANYFQVGVLVMAGWLKPVDPLPPDPHLLSWGHLMPVEKPAQDSRVFHVDGWVGGVAFHPDGKRVAVGSAEGLARIFKLEGNDAPRKFSGHEDGVVGVAFSPDGKTLATSSYDHTAILWDVATGEPRKRLTGHRGAVMSVAFSPDGKLVATGSVDTTIRVWDAASGKLKFPLGQHKSWVNAVAFAPSGKWLASASSDGTVKIFSLAGEVLHTLDATNAEVRSLAIRADSGELAVGIRYGRIRTWDTKTWQPRLDFQGHSSDVWAVKHLPDGKLLSGNGDWNRPGTVKLWDKTGKFLGQFQHTGEVTSLAVSPDGKRFAAGAMDRTVRSWPVGAAVAPSEQE